MEQERTIAPGVGVERHEEAVGERSHEEQSAEHHERQLVATHLSEHITSGATYEYNLQTLMNKLNQVSGQPNET